MQAALLEFLRPFWLPILKWSAITAAVAAVLLKIKDSGRQAERAEQLAKQTVGTGNANKVRDAVDLDYARGHVPDSVRKFYIDK